MIVRFFNGNVKKKNSTKIPSGSYSDLECKLKQPTSITEPTLELETDGYPSNWYNAYIPVFDRYYFVMNIVSKVNKIWTVYLIEDTLASFRSEILGSYQYVLRSASEVDDHILDTKYPSHNVNKVRTFGVNKIFSNTNIKSGTYVLGVTCTGSTSTLTAGSVKYYALDVNDMNQFLNDLIQVSLDNEQDITGMSDMALLGVVNPIQYIVSCTYIPVAQEDLRVGGVIGGTEKLGILTWKSNTTADIITSQHFTNSGTVCTSFPKHPQQTSKGDFVNLNNSSYSLYEPCIGEIPLDGTLMGDGTGIKYEYDLDITSGDGVVKLTTQIPNDDGTAMVDMLLTIMSVTVGVPIQLSQVNKDTNISNLSTAGVSIASAIAGSGVASTAVDKLTDISNEFERTGISTGNYYKGTDVEAKITGIIPWLLNKDKDSDNKKIMTITPDDTAPVKSAINDYVNAINVMKQSVGNPGSFGTYGGQPTLYCYFTEYVPGDNENHGRPLCRRRQLSALSGFCLCLEPALSAGNTYENAKILNYLASGFFIE